VDANASTCKKVEVIESLGSLWWGRGDGRATDCNNVSACVFRMHTKVETDEIGVAERSCVYSGAAAAGCLSARMPAGA